MRAEPPHRIGNQALTIGGEARFGANAQFVRSAQLIGQRAEHHEHHRALQTQGGEHFAHPRALAGEGGIDEGEGVEVRRIADRLGDIAGADGAARLQQFQLLDFLMRRQEIAFNAIRERVDGVAFQR